MDTVQSQKADHLEVGTLLVASRDLADPSFSKTVVLITQKDDDGVVGLILNRVTDVPVSRALEGLKGTEENSDPVYIGGPVGNTSVFALAKSPAKTEGADAVFGDVYLFRRKAPLELAIGKRPSRDRFHIYLGYAGWTNGQLRREVEIGAWFVFHPDDAMVFDPNPETLWQRLIKRTEQKFAKIGSRRARAA